MSEPFTSEEIEQVVWRLFATIDALQAENARLREQNKALAEALDTALFYSSGVSKLAQTRLNAARRVRRFYREEANHE